MTTQKQNELTAALDARNIDAKWNGDFLNCKVAIAGGRKTKFARFSFVFDSAEYVEGARICKTKGTYAEHFAAQAFGIILLIGSGREEAAKFVAERDGVTSEMVGI
jgi:hypothetical protein